MNIFVNTDEMCIDLQIHISFIKLLKIIHYIEYVVYGFYIINHNHKSGTAGAIWTIFHNVSYTQFGDANLYTECIDLLWYHVEHV